MSQLEKLYSIMLDGLPHRTDELVERVYGTPDRVTTIARLGARIWDIKKRYGVEIKSWSDPHNHKLWWYLLQKVAPNLAQDAFSIKNVASSNQGVKISPCQEKGTNSGIQKNMLNPERQLELFG